MIVKGSAEAAFELGRKSERQRIARELDAFLLDDKRYAELMRWRYLACFLLGSLLVLAGYVTALKYGHTRHESADRTIGLRLEYGRIPTLPAPGPTPEIETQPIGTELAP